jgi:hypothetical protein
VDALKAANEALKQQLDGFKHQLLGRKTEKQLIDNPFELGLAEILGETHLSSPQLQPSGFYTRRKAKRRDAGCVTEAPFA